MKGILVSLAVLATIAIRDVLAGAVKQSELPGLTHEEFVEYLTLESTDGWEPMARVPQYNVTEGEVLDLGGTALAKRGGQRVFVGYGLSDCRDHDLFTVQNFGCGVCITTPGDPLLSGWLFRETLSGDYPTADWYSDTYCGGPKLHHQGIRSGQYSSCDNLESSRWQSVMLYQGC
jgi:hypothetical protein